MKKVILSISALVALVFNVNAQVKYGPEIGLNMSKQTESGFTSNFLAGARIGGVVDFSFGDHIGLQPGIFFTMMGTKASSSLGDGDVKLNYIYVPVNLLYKFGEPDGNRFFVGVGPVIGYCLGGSESFGGTSYTIKVGSGTDYYTGYVKAIDFGADVILGYQLSNGLLFKAGYYMGLSDIQGNSGGQKTTNSAIQISVGWLFGGNGY